MTTKKKATVRPSPNFVARFGNETMQAIEECAALLDAGNKTATVVRAITLLIKHAPAIRANELKKEIAALTLPARSPAPTTPDYNHRIKIPSFLKNAIARVTDLESHQNSAQEWLDAGLTQEKLLTIPGIGPAKVRYLAEQFKVRGITLP